MIKFILAFVLAGLLMAVEYLICTRLKNPLWGGIIPALILIGTVYVFASGMLVLSWRNAFPFILCNTFAFADWEEGRNKYKTLRQSEIDKMKTKDINI